MGALSGDAAIILTAHILRKSVEEDTVVVHDIGIGNRDMAGGIDTIRTSRRFRGRKEQESGEG